MSFPWLVVGAGHGLVARTLSRVEDISDRPYVPLDVVGLCLLGAACYGLAAALQQQQASAAPADTRMRVGLLRHLLRQPLWLVGNLAGLGGWIFQFLALRRGSLALVQPLLISGLVFALVGSAALAHRRLSGREWRGAALVVAGLALFLVEAKPAAGHPTASTAGWITLGLMTLMVVGALWLGGRRFPRSRPLVLGGAGGVLFGTTAALAERTGHLLNGGWGHALSSWPPYALLCCAGVALLLTQSAFASGELRWSLPTLTIVEPLAAILIGQLLFGEHIALGGLSPVGELLGLAMMIAGALGLSRGMYRAHATPGSAPAPLQAPACPEVRVPTQDIAGR